MQFNSLVPNLMVKDMTETVSFYRDVLGFILVNNVPAEAPYNWAMMGRESVEIMFQTKPSLTEELPVLEKSAAGEGGALSFYINVEKIDDLYAKVKDHAPVVMDMRTSFYGAREFAIQDNNGFVLMFSEAPNEE